MKKTKSSVESKQRKLAAEQREAKAQYLKKQKRQAECEARRLENARAFKPGPVVKKGFNAKTNWPEGSPQFLKGKAAEAVANLSESLTDGEK